MLPKIYRLGKNDFSLIKKQDPYFKINLDLFIVKGYKSSNIYPSAAFIISKKSINKSSHRNLIRRRLKHLFYINRDKLNTYNYIFIVKGGFDCKNFTYEKISLDFNTLLSKILKLRNGVAF